MVPAVATVRWRLAATVVEVMARAVVTAKALVTAVALDCSVVAVTAVAVVATPRQRPLVTVAGAPAMVRAVVCSIAISATAAAAATADTQAAPAAPLVATEALSFQDRLAPRAK